MFINMLCAATGTNDHLFQMNDDLDDVVQDEERMDFSLTQTDYQ